MKQPKIKHPSGFTIVELLIVIVVIAILAAISIVAYNGIQNRANDAAVQSDLNNIAKRLSAHYIANGSLPTGWTAFNNLDPKLKVTRVAYGNHYVSGPSSYNLVYCFPAAQPGKFGLVARSQSGNVYEYTGGKVRLASYTFTGGSTNMCDRAGYPITSNTERIFFYDNNDWQTFLD